MLQRLKNRNHIDQYSLSTGAASNINDLPTDLLIGSAPEIIRNYWKEGFSLIVVGAIGAVVRMMAPLITTKDLDPCVLVIDSKALNIVPLLGGHKAGAEQFAQELAEDLGGKAIFTSASKSNARLALDSFGKAWGWNRGGGLDNWNELMILQSKEEAIHLTQFSGTRLWQNSKSASKCLGVLKTDNSSKSNSINIGHEIADGCSWHPPNIWIGIGCERNTSHSLICRSIDESFKEFQIAKEAIAGISTIEIKANEPALQLLVATNKWPIKFYSAATLSQISVPNPSERVNKEIGSSSVAEASALIAAGSGGELLMEKHIFHSTENEYGAVTIAIAKSVESFAPHKGELHLVGSGPGDIAFLTNDARFALSRCVLWIGYKPYLDLLESFRRDDQVRLDGKLTLEKERCKTALEYAKQGLRVALISSGDIGIYGMAGLALQLWLEEPKDERPYFQVHPGISALQIAASKIGAPLMHDFCSISLSDLLTPWEKIEERLKCAAIGDFVIALYNPRSEKRDWQLKRAIEILSENRSASTPIACCRQLGRSEEEIEIFQLDSFPIKKVDMLCVVVVGNTSSLLKDGVFLTPRGYSIN